MTAFGGFPPETIRFLRQLRANNRKDWFDAHRTDYEAFWVAPAKAFVVAAGQLLVELAPGIRAEPRVLGSIFRINRDTRFARDPVRTRITSTSGSGRASGAAPSAASSPA
jgi:uncharacterized protein (DUF2461 family)